MVEAQIIAADVDFFADDLHFLAEEVNFDHG